MFGSKKTAWLTFVAWLVLIFYLSSQPAFVVSEKSTLDNLAHIIAHMTEYGILAVLTYNLLTFYLSDLTVWFSFGFGLLWALSDEYHQSFVPTRSASWADVASDAVWLILGLVMVKYVFPRTKLRYKGLKI